MEVMKTGINIDLSRATTFQNVGIPSL